MRSFSLTFRHLRQHGWLTKPRGEKTLEIINTAITFEPYERFANFPSRKLSIPYIKAELLWYLRGDRTDLSIVEKAKLWEKMITPEGTLNSNYGAAIFKEGGLDYVVSTLLKDPDSRRAVITILGAQHLYVHNPDVPCTSTLSFLIREGKLHSTVHMRSTDAVYGLTNDIPFFSFVQEAVLISLNDSQTEAKQPIELGSLILFTNSLHVYERHFDMLEKLTSEEVVPVDCPRLKNKFELDFLRIGLIPRFPNNYKFTSWLHDINVQIEDNKK